MMLLLLLLLLNNVVEVRDMARDCLVVVVHIIVGLVEVDKCARERDEHIVICMDSILSLYSII